MASTAAPPLPCQQADLARPLWPADDPPASASRKLARRTSKRRRRSANLSEVLSLRFTKRDYSEMDNSTAPGRRALMISSLPSRAQAYANPIS